MAKYTNLTSEEIAEFGKAYSIGEVINYYPMGGGLTNSSFYIQTRHQKYILTICEHKTQQQAIMVTNLLNHLHKHRFLTNEVISLKNNEFVFLFNKKPVYLKKFLEGGTMEKPTGKIIEQLGTLIAQLHDIPVPDDISLAHPYGLSHFVEVTSTDLEHPYIGWLRIKLNYLQKSIPDNLPKGLVHGDIFPDNLIQIKGDLKAIIDFEEASNYPKIFDLGMATIGIYSDLNTIDMKFPKALLRGYQMVRILKPLERENLKLFTIYSAVALSFWRFRQFHIRFPYSEKSRPFQQMVDFADKLIEMDNYEFINKIFN